MRVTRTMFIGAAVSMCIAATVGPASAASQSANGAPQYCPTAGFICAYEHIDYKVTGAICGWFNNDRDWASCGEYWHASNNMLNKASSIRNYSSGFSEPNNVNLYYNRPWENSGYSAWACIGQGDAWPWLGDRFFSWGPSGPGDTGKNLSTQDNITGHKWVVNCGDA